MGASAKESVARAAIVRACSVLIALDFMMNVSFAGPPGTIHYPDLQTLPPSDIGIEYDRTTGHKLLRFSNAIANLGEGPLEVIPTNNATTATTDAYQRLYSHDQNGNWYVASTVYVGTFVFHPQHNHWHFEDFARYELHDVAPDGSIGSTVLSSSQKVSFCLTDYAQVDSSLEHSATATYIPCEQTDPQGISVGWADVYDWYLEGQSLDITGLPDGDYWLVSTADPDNLLNEGGGAFERNNTSSVKVQIASELVWMDDALPAGAITGASDDSWTWVSSDPAPFSGSLAHQSNIATGLHQHYFDLASVRLPINRGNILFAYVFLDPANLPSEVMLEWTDGFLTEQRAYWGANQIDLGLVGTATRRYMGPLPPAGQWVRLEVPASLLELEGIAVNGMSFTLFNGRATWDYAGVRFAPDNRPPNDAALPVVAITAPTNNATVSGVIRVTAEASDDLGLPAVQLKLDGANLGPEMTTTPYEFSWDTTSTGDGLHTLSAVARDAAGNESVSSPVAIAVLQNTAPTISFPPPTTLTCSPPDGLEVMLSAEFRDADGDALTVTWNVDESDLQTNSVPPSGPPATTDLTLTRKFTPGTHLVRATVSDGKDSAMSESRVTIEVDSTPPVITCPVDIVAPADPDQCSAAIDYSVAVADDCSGAMAICKPPSGSVFPRGTTTVSCTATDAAGNESNCSFPVTVNDTEAPVVTGVSASPNVLWPPDHAMVPVTVNANARDNCGVVTPRIIAVTSNESGDGSSGSTENPAWEITGPLSVSLRAERSGQGGGRVYTITIEWQDTAGNQATDRVTVDVPPSAPSK